MITVVVTWMDGQQETYRCDKTRVDNGVLYLVRNRYPASDEPQRAIPLVNVRIWLVSD